MKREVVALLGGRAVGRVTQAANGEYRFRYHEAWRDQDHAFPLSLSLPLTRLEHGDAPVRAYLWNLLPDNDAVLASWGRLYQVSPNNPLALLSHVGEDCPGALQLVSPERAEQLLLGSAEAGGVEWLTEAEVAHRLAHVREEPGAGRERGDAGRFSLAGAQPKIALLFDGERWGVPFGRVPTTHILKPPAQRAFDGFAENEHVCLRLAQRLGLPAVHSQVRRFGDQAAIVVRRFDRISVGGELVRLHQEDFCQALGVLPQSKYEAEGGPRAVDIIRVLQERSDDPSADVASVIGALALNWVIGGTDAHAKNYSHLMQPAATIRLAELYDIISLLPYREGRGPRVKLAMKVGGEYRMRSIGRRHWEKLAAEIGAHPNAVVALVREIVEQTPDHLRDVCREAAETGADHPVLERLRDAVAVNAGACLTRLLDGVSA